MALLTTILSVFGSGLGALFSWAVSWFEKKQAEKDQAAAQMNQDIIDHAIDGEKSVNDMESLENQLDNLKQQAENIDQPKPEVKP